MAWFQRYGIPGACFLGLLALWTVSFFSCDLGDIVKGDSATIVAAIAAISFVPIGYLISILQQIIYLWWKKPWFGITGKAIREANVFQDTQEREYLLEAEACLLVMSEKVNIGNNEIKDNKLSVSVDKQRFLQDWIRNRNNVMAVNASLMLATLLAPISVWLFPKIFDLATQIDSKWCWFAGIISGIVFGVSACSWCILRCEVVRVEAGIYKMLSGQPGSNLVLNIIDSDGQAEGIRNKE